MVNKETAYIIVAVVVFLAQFVGSIVVLVKPLLKVNATMQKLIDITENLVKRADAKEEAIRVHEKELHKIDNNLTSLSNKVDYHEVRITDLEEISKQRGI